MHEAGSSLLSIGKALGVSNHTVARYLERLGLKSPPTPGDVEQERVLHRDRWLSTLAAHQKESIIALRHIDGHNYYWLLKNDWEWLSEHLPAEKSLMELDTSLRHH